ncbi:hypothetical protein [Amycolatopsis sp. NPDC049868]|uniref:hypothetical protein n=1 Tax=Amycolatopsis sp. NPDC049868 TaxID=3363934 RepID=UPI00379A238A
MPGLTVSSAQRPVADTSDDRIFTTRSAVIVLDGASAYAPIPVSPSTYADSLGRHLHDHLDHDMSIDLADASPMRSPRPPPNWT